MGLGVELIHGGIDGSCRLVAHEAGNGQGNGCQDLSVQDDGHATLLGFQGLDGSSHVPVVRAGDDDVMRIVGNGHGDGAPLQAVTAQQAQADVARAVMAFDDGDLDDIGLRVVNEIAAVVAPDGNLPLFSDDASRQDIDGPDLVRCQVHDQFIFRKAGNADGTADGAVIGSRKGQAVPAFFGYFPAADEGRQGLEVLQILEEDDVRPLARCQGAAVVEVIAVGGVEGRHGNGRFRRQAGGDAEAQVFVEVAFLENRLGMKVVRAEQKPAQVGRRHSLDQVGQVMAGRAVAQHDIYTGLEARFDVIQGETFVVRPDPGRCIGLQVLARDTGAVAVDGLVGVIGGDELVQDGIVAVQDARAVHKFADAEDAVVCQGPFHIVGFQHSAAVVERRRRDARRHHEAENGTTVRTEILAGITTFMTMAYILAVNPTIMSAAGMDKGAVLTATALASFIGTLCMAFFANYPFALAPGMGLNAFFAFTVVLQMGYTWEMALAAVFFEGLIFIVLSLTNVREAIFNAIPITLKKAVSAGIGLFIALIGLLNAQIIVANPATKIALFSFKQSAATGTFHTVGITVLLAMLGIVFTAVLMVKKVRGNILWGILFTWILAILCELTGLYVPNPEMKMFSVIPDLSGGAAAFAPASLSPILGQLDFSRVFSLDFLVVMFAFLFVDIFDTLGTLIGVSSKANMLDERGRLPRIKGALLADAVATTIGAVLGTSTTTTFVESATGVSEGGRTGLTAVCVAVLFALSLFLSPFFMAIPAFATAPALVIVGFLMLTSVAGIDFNDFSESIPAYITIIAMPFCYSISEGISFGIISYVVINLLTGKREKISLLMYCLAVIFVMKYIFL